MAGWRDPPRAAGLVKHDRQQRGMSSANSHAITRKLCADHNSPSARLAGAGNNG